LFNLAIIKRKARLRKSIHVYENKINKGVSLISEIQKCTTDHLDILNHIATFHIKLRQIRL